MEIKSIEEAKNSANLISEELFIGINYNFAPVVDLAKNSVVGYRGFGAKKENLIPWSNAFIRDTEKTLSLQQNISQAMVLLVETRINLYKLSMGN